MRYLLRHWRLLRIRQLTFYSARSITVSLVSLKVTWIGGKEFLQYVILSGILISLSAQNMQGAKIICVIVYQVDVLESQFSQLLHQINSTRDFESIRLAHDHFLSNLLAQSFILLKPVSRTWFPQTASSLFP